MQNYQICSQKEIVSEIAKSLMEINYAADILALHMTA